MANAVYPEYKQFLLEGAATVSLNVDDATDGPFCALVDTGTSPYSASHSFYNDGSGTDIESGNVGTDQRITAPTVANGTFDGGDLTYTSVSGATVEALVIYRHNAGADTTWKVVLYLDTNVTGLPLTPNGGNVTVTWAGGGIFTLSDRRTKENISEIGSVGVLPVYRFNYIGDEAVRTGLMAQDIEKIAPAAVIDFGKFKAVNYDLAIEYGMAA